MPKRNAGYTLAGYTLIELMIVLAILAALTSIAAPGVRNWLDKGKLRAAVRDVQAALAKTRSTAIREGRVVEFHCVEGSANYELRSVDVSATFPVVVDIAGADNETEGMAVESQPASVSVENQRGIADAAAMDTNGPSTSVTPRWRTLRRWVLPTGMTFVRADSRQNLPGDADSIIATDSTDSTAVPSDISIYFLPNGRTEDAVIRVQGGRDFVAEVHLRGLTATATTTSPFRVTTPTTPVVQDDLVVAGDAFPNASQSNGVAAAGGN